MVAMASEASGLGMDPADDIKVTFAHMLVDLTGNVHSGTHMTGTLHNGQFGTNFGIKLFSQKLLVFIVCSQVL